jgi:quinol-cytochrome oxidoreductase complex cytochrome b subunit
LSIARELALYSFVVLLVTGIYLTLFFEPSISDTVYRGSYGPMRGLEMSNAYASTLQISFDVRGGLLVRQVHHWAADIFLAAIAIHLARIFFTGSFRRPRETNWIIGVTLFALSMFEGLPATPCRTTCSPAPACVSHRASCSPSPSSAPTCRSSSSAASTPGP